MVNRSCFSHNNYHLGDCLQSLHLIRALAKEHHNVAFVFFTHGCNLPQLREVVADLPNIILADFESELWRERQHESVDMWKNFDHFWENSRFRWDWSRFMIEHHDWTANRMGYLSPFKIREHLLLDYPALEVQQMKAVLPENCGEFTYEFLIGDSAPSSGQYAEWADHSREPLKILIESLRAVGREVVTTSQGKEFGWSISYLGKVSQLCRHHIMVANAPFFCTLNTSNHHHHEGRKRIALLDGPEQMAMPNIIQCGSVAEVLQIAKEEGWI